MTRAGEVARAGTGAARRYADCHALPRGRHFQAPDAPATPLPPLDEVAHLLPAPWVAGHPEYRACYDFCVRILFGNRRSPEPGSGFVSPFIDSAFNTNVFLWDTAFITMFARLLHPYVPGICSLDNFYARQFDDGEICREIDARTGEDLVWWTNLTGGPLYSFYHRAYGYRSLAAAAADIDLDACLRPDLGRTPAQAPHLTLDALNHPVAAWAELLSVRQTGDLDRLARVVPPLFAYYSALDEHLRHVRGVYATDWASMDNSPRNAYLAFGVDTAAQMVLFAENLVEASDLLQAAGRRVDVDRDLLRRRAAETSAAVNDLMWDDARRFYFDLDEDLRRGPVRTVAAFWTLLAGIATGDRAEALVTALQDPDAFARPHPVPTLAADEPGYDPEGAYWRGGTWAPTNMMVVAGLERLGRHDLAAAIARRHVDAVARLHAETGTVYEYYAPDLPGPGNNDHVDFVGWSGLGPISFLLGQVIGLEADAPAGVLHWRLHSPDSAFGVERYRFGPCTVDLAAERTPYGWRLDVETDQPFTLVVHVPGGATWRIPVDGRENLDVATP